METALGTIPRTAARDFLAANGLTDGQRFDGADVIDRDCQGVDGTNLVIGAIGIRVPTRFGLSFGLSCEHVSSDWEDRSSSDSPRW